MVFFCCKIYGLQSCLSAWSWAVTACSFQSLCKSVVQFQSTIHSNGHVQFVPLFVILICAKAFSLKRLSQTDSLVKTQHIKQCQWYLWKCADYVKNAAKTVSKLVTAEQMKKVHENLRCARTAAFPKAWPLNVVFNLTLTNTIVFLHKATHAVTLSRPWVVNRHKSIATVSLRCHCLPNWHTSFITADIH